MEVDVLTLTEADVLVIPSDAIVVDDSHDIGRGGYGDVYRARWRQSQRFGSDAGESFAEKTVCVKAFYPIQMLLREGHEESGEEFQKAVGEFLHEARMLMRLSHPNIVSFYGITMTTSNRVSYPQYIVMELANRCLEKYLKWKSMHGASITLSDVRAFSVGVLTALSYLHSIPVIHRDVKAANVLVFLSQGCAQDAPAVVYKLGDVGLARVANTMRMSLRGTPQFIAPEVLSGLPYTISADVFSFGAMLADIVLMFLCRPGRSISPVPIQRSADIVTAAKFAKDTLAAASLSRLIEWCCAVEPAERPAAPAALQCAKEIMGHVEIQEAERQSVLADVASQCAALQAEQQTTNVRLAEVTTELELKSQQLLATEISLEHRTRELAASVEALDAATLKVTMAQKEIDKLRARLAQLQLYDSDVSVSASDDASHSSRMPRTRNTMVLAASVDVHHQGSTLTSPVPMTPPSPVTRVATSSAQPLAVVRREGHVSTSSAMSSLSVTRTAEANIIPRAASIHAPVPAWRHCFSRLCGPAQGTEKAALRMCSYLERTALLHGTIPATVARDFVSAMAIWEASERIQLRCCVALATLTRESGRNDASVCAAGGLQRLFCALRRHSDSPGLVAAACNALGNLAENPKFRDNIAGLDGVRVLFDAMEEHARDAGVQEAACAALRNLAMNRGIATRIVEEGGLARLLATAEIHRSVSDVVDVSVAVVRNLAQSEANVRKVLASGWMARLKDILDSPSSPACTVKTASLALGNIVAHCDSPLDAAGCAGRESEVDFTGFVPCLFERLEQFRALPPVVNAILGVVMNLASSAPASELVLADGRIELLLSLLAQHEDMEGIQIRGCAAIGNTASWGARCRAAVIASDALSRVVAALQRFVSTKGVAEQACWALSSMLETCESPAVQLAVLESPAPAAVLAAMDKHVSNGLVQGCGCQVLEALLCVDIRQQSVPVLLRLGADQRLQRIVDTQAEFHGFRKQPNPALLLSWLRTPPPGGERMRQESPEVNLDVALEAEGAE